VLVVTAEPDVTVHKLRLLADLVGATVTLHSQILWPKPIYHAVIFYSIRPLSFSTSKFMSFII